MYVKTCFLCLEALINEKDRKIASILGRFEKRKFARPNPNGRGGIQHRYGYPKPPLAFYVASSKRYFIEDVDFDANVTKHTRCANVFKTNLGQAYELPGWCGSDAKKSKTLSQFKNEHLNVKDLKQNDSLLS